MLELLGAKTLFKLILCNALAEELNQDGIYITLKCSGVISVNRWGLSYHSGFSLRYVLFLQQ